MKLDTRKNIGNAGLAMAIAYYGSNGYTVSVPLNDTQDYDIVVDMDGKLNKVQVKATTYLDKNGSYQIPLRSISGTTRKPYKTVSETDIDLLFCLCGDGTMFSIPASAIENKNVITLRRERSKYSNPGCDYSKYIVSFDG